MIENGHPKDRQGLSITEYMHQHGVNIRHIGLLRACLRNHLVDKTTTTSHTSTERIILTERLLSQLLQECIGRALKNILRDVMRMQMCSQEHSYTTSEDSMIQLVVRFLNLVTGYHAKAGHFWRDMLIPGVISR